MSAKTEALMTYAFAVASVVASLGAVFLGGAYLLLLYVSELVQ